MRGVIAGAGLLLALAHLSGCGGSVDGGGTGVTVPKDLDAGSGGRGSGSGGAPAGGRSGSGAGGSGGVSYRDPACPPVKSVPGVYECDPFSLVDCGAGNRCTPYVMYADDCGTEKIGTTCSVAGPGTQGDDCTLVTCAAGYVCATGGIGLRCVKLCKPELGSGACAPGLICVALDVAGFFVCD